jgi:hypothetical protein
MPAKDGEISWNIWGMTNKKRLPGKTGVVTSNKEVFSQKWLSVLA